MQRRLQRISLREPEKKRIISVTDAETEYVSEEALRRLRRRKGLNHNCPGLRHAAAKYGWETLKFDLLEPVSDCTPDSEELYACEQKWMDHYGPEKLYNEAAAGYSRRYKQD